MICGIDNGIGTLGFVGDNKAFIFKTPTFKDKYYTKPIRKRSKSGKMEDKQRECTRIHTAKLAQLLETFKPTQAVLERPFVNPKMFQATISSVRAMEAIMVTLEQHSIPYKFIDSKEWQKNLPEGNTKEQSLLIAKELFPEIDFSKFKDADGLLIAYYENLLN